jgi:hypothetical protein
MCYLSIGASNSTFRGTPDHLLEKRREWKSLTGGPGQRPATATARRVPPERRAGTHGASAATKVLHLKFVVIPTASHGTGHGTFVGTDVNRHHGKVVGYDTVSGKFNIHTHKAFLG